MAGAKLIVLYPMPRDVNTFERAYTQDHVPMVSAQNFNGIKKFVASKVVGTRRESGTLLSNRRASFPIDGDAPGRSGFVFGAEGRRARGLDFDRRETNRARFGRRNEEFLGRSRLSGER
jgi:hypothetical protein